MKDVLPILRLTALLLFVIGTGSSTYFYTHTEEISIQSIFGLTLLVFSPALTAILWFLVRFWKRPILTGAALLKDKLREEPVDPKSTRLKWSSGDDLDTERAWHQLIVIFEGKEYSVVASARDLLNLSEGDSVSIRYRRSRIGSTIDVICLAQS